MTQALEQMLSSVPRMGQEDRSYQTLDVYTSGLSQMYTGPMKPPQLTIRDMPASGVQLHIHEGQGGTAHLRTYDRQKILMNSYDAAMLDHYLQQSGNKQIKK